MGDIVISGMRVGLFQTNCYFIHKEGNQNTIVVDPGDRADSIYEEIVKQNLNVSAILLTHGHFDHILGVKEFKEKTHAKVYAGADEAELLKDPAINASERVRRPEIIVPDVLFKDKEQVTIGDLGFEVIFTPGHTKGSVCYYFKEAGILISGDTLFEESVGRCDFPTGSERALLTSIKERLMVLPDETKVYPGHGAPTTIGNERKYNTFIN